MQLCAVILVRSLLTPQSQPRIQKLSSLRLEADNAVQRAEDAEAKNKKYEQLLLEKDQEITSLQHKLSVLDADLEKAESKLSEAKLHQEEGEQSKTTNEGLQRKIQLLEEELDAAEKNVKETVEKCVHYPHFRIPFPHFPICPAWAFVEWELTALILI